MRYVGDFQRQQTPNSATPSTLVLHRPGCSAARWGKRSKRQGRLPCPTHLVHSRHAAVAQEAVHAAQVACRLHHCGRGVGGKGVRGKGSAGVCSVLATHWMVHQAWHSTLWSPPPQYPGKHHTCDAAAALAAECARDGPQVVHQPKAQLQAASVPAASQRIIPLCDGEGVAAAAANRLQPPSALETVDPCSAHLNSCCSACLATVCGSASMSSSSTVQAPPPSAACQNASCTSVACGGPPQHASAVVSSGGHSASIPTHNASSSRSLLFGCSRANLQRVGWGWID